MTHVYLLYGLAVLLLAIFLLLLRINAKISHLAHKGDRPEKPKSASALDKFKSNDTNVQPGSAFEEFLREFPDRSVMSKKEQFEAYRKWRSDKGLNWK
jgi:hypothetical protein